MRASIALFAAMLAACQSETPMNEAAEPVEQAVPAATGNAVSNELPAGTASRPNEPVSSDDRQPAPREPTAPSAGCPVIESSGWHAHVDALPGPNARPRLVVSGKVTVPTGGYKVALRMGQVAESYPVQVTVYLDATAPSGMASQAVVTHEVRGSWPSEERVGSVTVRCGGKALARLSNIETAR